MYKSHWESLGKYMVIVFTTSLMRILMRYFKWSCMQSIQVASTTPECNETETECLRWQQTRNVESQEYIC